ncbi:MAG: ATP-binding protein [Planctomycetota bacterium]|nr:ATP-binding protein [Planctomycetota bacterium]
MGMDLSADLRKALRDAMRRADGCISGGNSAGAAEALAAASRISFHLAEHAPSREAEIREKKRAIRLRERAKGLLAGDDSADENGENAPQSGGDEISALVSELIHTSKVTWDQIGGLEETKSEIKYSLGLTLANRPDGVELAGWRAILFYGPPGTGKTLLAAATSNAIRTDEKDRAVFFNVKVANVLSKFFGESSKIISELYGAARDMSPSIIFLDEFEALCASRDGADSGPERRILSTILSELDGLAEKGRDDLYVLTIAATNRPWDLDPAILSRFEKKILIPLPDRDAREAILDIHLSRRGIRSKVSMEELAGMTEGFSGRELESFCKQVIYKMIRERNESLPEIVDRGLDAVRSYKIKVRELARADFEDATQAIRPQTSPEDAKRYLEWGTRLDA